MQADSTATERDRQRQRDTQRQTLWEMNGHLTSYAMVKEKEVRNLGQLLSECEPSSPLFNSNAVTCSSLF